MHLLQIAPPVERLGEALRLRELPAVAVLNMYIDVILVKVLSLGVKVLDQIAEGVLYFTSQFMDLLVLLLD